MQLDLHNPSSPLLAPPLLKELKADCVSDAEARRISQLCSKEFWLQVQDDYQKATLENTYLCLISKTWTSAWNPCNSWIALRKLADHFLTLHPKFDRFKVGPAFLFVARSYPSLSSNPPASCIEVRRAFISWALENHTTF